MSHQILEARGIPFTAVRFFNTYGPGQTYTPYVGVLTIFITRLLRGESITSSATANSSATSSTSSDIVAGTMATPGRDAGPLQPRHGPRHVAQSAGGDGAGETRARPEGDSMRTRTAGELRFSVADIGAARRALGFSPTRSLQQDLDDVIAWVREREVQV